MDIEACLHREHSLNLAYNTYVSSEMQYQYHISLLKAHFISLSSFESACSYHCKEADTLNIYGRIKMIAPGGNRNSFWNIVNLPSWTKSRCCSTDLDHTLPEFGETFCDLSNSLCKKASNHHDNLPLEMYSFTL